METPKLLIIVQGGKTNFALQPKLKKVLRVTRQVADALLLERSSGHVVALGIVENNFELFGLNRDVPFLTPFILLLEERMKKFCFIDVTLGSQQTQLSNSYMNAI